MVNAWSKRAMLTEVPSTVTMGSYVHMSSYIEGIKSDLWGISCNEQQ